jgi:hypothetical protein
MAVNKVVLKGYITVADSDLTAVNAEMAHDKGWKRTY